jgi:hypothetical protein
VRINSRHGRADSGVRCEPTATGTCTSHVRGGTDALTLHMAGRPALWSSGEWSPGANAGDGQTRTFNAGVVEMFTAVPTGDIAFGTIERQHARARWMWSTLPCGRTSCRYARGTYSWEGVHNVRKSTPKSFHLDVPVDGAGPRRTRREWGTRRTGPLTKRTRISPPIREVTSCSVPYHPHCQAGRRIDGHRTSAWLRSQGPAICCCSTLANLQSSVLPEHDDIHFDGEHPTRCIHVWRMDHNRRRPRVHGRW